MLEIRMAITAVDIGVEVPAGIGEAELIGIGEDTIAAGGTAITATVPDTAYGTTRATSIITPEDWFHMETTWITSQAITIFTAADIGISTNVEPSLLVCTVADLA